MYVVAACTHDLIVESERPHNMPVVGWFISLAPSWGPFNTRSVIAESSEDLNIASIFMNSLQNSSTCCLIQTSYKSHKYNPYGRLWRFKTDTQLISSFYYRDSKWHTNIISSLYYGDLKRTHEYYIFVILRRFKTDTRILYLRHTTEIQNGHTVFCST